MHVIIYSHGFPNPVEKHRNAFVKEIIRFISPSFRITVIAPVPFFLSLRRSKHSTIIPMRHVESIGDKGISIYHPRYPLLPNNLLKPIIGFLEAIFTLHCLLYINKIRRVDLIHVNWAYPDGVAVNCLSRCTRIPYVVTEHQGAIRSLLNSAYYNYLIGNVYRHSRQLILVSPSLINALQTVRGVLPKPVIIPNAIDVEIYPIVTKQQAPRKLVYIGNLIPSKGIEYLLTAMSSLQTIGVEMTLDVIGNGYLKDSLIRLVAKLGLSEQVTFLGIVTPDRIPQLLVNYDLLVLPTLVESFGMVIIEAMAAGLPVLSTYSGGPAYIVTPETGALVQPASSEALVQGLLDIEKRWTTFDPNSIRAYCQHNFDLRTTSKALEKVYLEAVEPK